MVGRHVVALYLQRGDSEMLVNGYEERRAIFLQKKKEYEEAGDLEAAAIYKAAADQPFCFLLPGEKDPLL